MTFSGGSETPKRRGLIKLYAPLLIWIGVIFVLSGSQGSMNQTSRIIRPILEFLFPSAPEETLQIYHGIIRKTAHFTEYAILGLLGVRAFRRAAPSFLVGHPFASATGLVILVASVDEINQSFNPARTGSAIDVLIDISGGIAAIIFLYLLARKRQSSVSDR